MSDFRLEINTRAAMNAINSAKERALTKIGLVVQDDARLRSPVDTGNLRGSIDHKVNVSDDSVAIGTNLKYGIFVEKGTSRQKAQPYLEPAATENRGLIERIAREELGRI